jgi:hypothetical protein
VSLIVVRNLLESRSYFISRTGERRRRDLVPPRCSIESNNVPKGTRRGLNAVLLVIQRVNHHKSHNKQQRPGSAQSSQSVTTFTLIVHIIQEIENRVIRLHAACRRHENSFSLLLHTILFPRHYFLFFQIHEFALIPHR